MKNKTITVLYDGLCPLCKREIRHIKRLDKHNRIEAVNIAEADFNPALYGCTFSQVNGQIHAFLPDGTCITGMEVFRQLYSSLGLGFLINWTKLPVAQQVTNKMYSWFARNRYKLTGRSNEQHNNPCVSGRCSANQHKKNRHYRLSHK